MSRLVILLLVLGLPAVASAHPGRLDATACHNVLKDFRYADGRELKAGTRHCHGIGGTAATLGFDWSAAGEHAVRRELDKAHRVKEPQSP